MLKMGVRKADYFNFVDDRLIGITRLGCYNVAVVPAGDHVLWTKTGTNVAAVELTVEAGETYYVRQLEAMRPFSWGGTYAKLRLAEDPRKARAKLDKALHCRSTAAGLAAAEGVLAEHYAKAKDQAVRISTSR